MSRTLPLRAAAMAGCAFALLFSNFASAAEPYAAVGFPFAVIGVAQPLNDRLTVRADLGVVSDESYNRSTSDQTYQGKFSDNRIALLGDWFVFGNGLRLTGGATINHTSLTMKASALNG